MPRAPLVLRRAAHRSAWWWRLRRHHLRTAPGLSMEHVASVLARHSSREALERVEEIRRLCKARDHRPEGARKHGSTSIEDGYFLYLLVRWLRPQTIFEVGTLIGTSASILAEAQIDASLDGVVFTVDKSYEGFEPLERHAISCFRKQMSTEALEVLMRIGTRLDLVFFDGSIDRADVALLNRIGTDRLVIATHDFKPPLDKGICNAWFLSKYLADAGRRVWILPQRQGLGYEIGGDVAINSSIALCLPEALLRDFESPPPVIPDPWVTASASSRPTRRWNP